MGKREILYANVNKNFQKSQNSYNWRKWCHFCKKPFSEKEIFVRLDVQVTCMRGDDEVYCFHRGCFNDWIEALEEQYGKSIPVSKISKK